MVARLRIGVGLAGDSRHPREQSDAQEVLPKLASKLVARLNLRFGLRLGHV
ncbi:hypothetical protein LMG22037_06055 [Paraburkholderia phenoliruptrix]|uniref:Uncharacterized protein n=1 Tax=Paraburkholderia phenoliruptrix TaxID=252970 RepID=A0A6J5CGG3_9BURK|nr:hypothetical protein LMG22037_06055 [Paraburkholderia phenoliruptrix]